MTEKPSARWTPAFAEFATKFQDFLRANGIDNDILVMTSTDFTPADGFLPSSYLILVSRSAIIRDHSICINLSFASGDQQKDEEAMSARAWANVPDHRALAVTWRKFLDGPKPQPVAPVHPYIGKPVPGLDGAFYNNSNENNQNALIVVGSDKYILKAPPGIGGMFAKYWFKVNQ